MTATTREERDELIARDTGAPEGTVWTFRTSANRGGRPCYHADPECPFQGGSSKEQAEKSMTRREAQLRWLPPCRVCNDLAPDPDSEEQPA